MVEASGPFSAQSEKKTQNFELNAGQGQWELSFFTEIFPRNKVFKMRFGFRRNQLKKLENELPFTKMAVKQLEQSPV